MDIINELKRIGKSEINWSISYFYDNCWQVRLGDDLNGFTWEASFDSFEKAVNKLIQEIIRKFPDSDYIKQLHKRSSSVFQGLDFFEEK
ncbi:hypothetical protein LCGC14_3007440 [marine sediment metagenome]|uniref:Uncharacterized protein n=1 Tax=marine sediment metagenome TaxID=412755 RepID=A0A0F8XLZ5_9ZZZZ